MARLRPVLSGVVSLLRGLGLVSLREVQSYRSIAGQNFFLFVGFVALQPQSAEFFLVILALILLFPLSSDPLQKIPADRRATWPLHDWEWAAIRVCSLALSPLAWIAILLLLRAGWRAGALAIGGGISAQAVAYLRKRLFRGVHFTALRSLPSPPGVIGALMRLHGREMLRTLDPYVALALVAITVLYRATGRPLDAEAPRIMALVAAVAMSTQTQVLLGIDGHGAERYRYVPLRGWRILLAKDLAFLTLLAVLVAPLDLLSGLTAGIVALAMGHHRSVLSPVRQAPWRFTSGAILPDGLIQVAVLFAAGNTVHSAGLPFVALCVGVWLASLVLYGWIWDRRARR